jgi:hypothetical protein
MAGDWSRASLKPLIGSDQAGHKDGTADVALLNSPFGVAVDAVRRRVLFTEWGGYCVRAWYIDEKRVATIAGTPGQCGFSDSKCSTAQWGVRPTLRRRHRPG